MRLQAFFAGTTSLVALAIASPSLAQSAQLDEVIVTAQRRAEDVQRIPLSVTAVTGDRLTEQGVRTAADLTAIVPGVQIAANGSSVEIAVRGIGSTNNTEVGDPAVAFNMDGIYLGRPRSASAMFYDVDRVEVLRGPQGTLYGRNATAGTLNLITRKPTKDYGGYAEAEIGNYALLRTAGALNVPINDQLAFRAAFQTERHDGYANSNPSRDYYDADNVAGRLHVLFTPTDTFTLLLSADYSHEGGSSGDPGSPIGTYRLPNESPYSFPISADGSKDQTNFGYLAQADLDLNFATLTYLGSYRRDETRNLVGQTRNYDPNGPRGTRCEPISGAGCTVLDLKSNQHQESHEIRLGANEGPLKWVAGLYFYKEGNNVLFNVRNQIAFLQPDTFSESKAAFAQATYSVTDSLRLTAGLRGTRDTKGRTGGTYIGLRPDFTCGNPNGLNTPLAQGGCLLYANLAEYTWNSTNYKLGAEYDLTPAVLAYAQISTGYKAGGYGDGPPPNNNKYEPERLKAIEGGIKSRLWNNRAQANLSVFHYDYTDFQASALGVVAGQPSNITVNAQEAKLYGAELEGTFLATDDDRFDFSVAYLHAKYESFILPRGDAFFPGRADYSGLTLAKSPEWTLNGSYEHTFRLANEATLKARIQTHYETEKNLDYHNFALTQQDAYTKTDISLAYAPGENRWSVMAYVRNLEDKAVMAQAGPNAQGVDRFGGSAHYAPPRLYGAMVSAKF